MLDTENLVILSGRAIMDSRKEKELEFCTRGMVLAFFVARAMAEGYMIDTEGLDERNVRTFLVRNLFSLERMTNCSGYYSVVLFPSSFECADLAPLCENPRKRV